MDYSNKKFCFSKTLISSQRGSFASPSSSPGARLSDGEGDSRCKPNSISYILHFCPLNEHNIDNSTHFQ